MRSFTASLSTTLFVAVAVTAGALLDVLSAPVAAPSLPEPEAAEAVSGAWYCAVGDTEGENELTLLGAVAPARTTSTRLSVHSFSEGGVIRGGEAEVLPGAVRAVPILSGQREVGVVARWRPTPAAVARIWRRTVVGEPSGLLAGACESQPSSEWYLPGISTAGGASARLVVANPFPTDAAISVTLLTEDGPLQPELLKNVAVRARGVRVIELNDHAPERPDLGAVVTVRAGRVVAEAWQALDSAIGGVDGLALARLARSAAETWTVPWIPGGDLETWIWVANANEDPATLAFTVHTSAGGSPLEGIDELLVPAGGVRRVELRGLLPEGAHEGAVTVAATNGVPVVVSGAVRVTGVSAQGRDETDADGGEAAADEQEAAADDAALFPAEATGFAVELGHPGPDGFWALVGVGTDERSETLHLANPTSELARVSIRVAVETASLTPDELQDIRVPAGAAVSVDVAAILPDLGPHAVFVETQGAGVVAGLRSAATAAPLDLVTNIGVPGATWAPRTPPARVEFSPGLARRLGTSSGPALLPDEVLAPTTEPEFEPSPSPTPVPSE